MQHIKNLKTADLVKLCIKQKKLFLAGKHQKNKLDDLLRMRDELKSRWHNVFPADLMNVAKNFNYNDYSKVWHMKAKLEDHNYLRWDTLKYTKQGMAAHSEYMLLSEFFRPRGIAEGPVMCPPTHTKQGRTWHGMRF